MESTVEIPYELEGRQVLLRAELRVVDESCNVWLLLHGLGHSSEHPIQRAIAAGLGVNTCRLNCVDPEQDQGILRYGGHNEWVKQVRSTIMFLEERDYSVVGIIGHSKGSAVAFQYSIVHLDRKLRFIVAIAARAIVGRTSLSSSAEERVLSEGFVVKDIGGGKQLKTTAEDLVERKEIRMEPLAKIGTLSRVLICHGKRDKLIPWSNAEELADLFDPQRTRTDVLITPGAGHNYYQNEDDLANAINEWIVKRAHDQPSHG